MDNDFFQVFIFEVFDAIKPLKLELTNVAKLILIGDLWVAMCIIEPGCVLRLHA